MGMAKVTCRCQSRSVAALITVLGGICGWFLYTEGKGGLKTREAETPKQRSLQGDLVELLHNRDFIITSILQGIFNMGQFIIQSYLVLYLIESLRYSPVYAGFVMGAVQLIGSISRILWGLMSDFIFFTGRRLPTLLVISLVTVSGLVGLGLLKETTPVWIVWVITSAAGAGCIGFAGTAILLRAELAGKSLAATTTGVGMAISFLGTLLGPPFFWVHCWYLAVLPNCLGNFSTCNLGFNSITVLYS